MSRDSACWPAVRRRSLPMLIPFCRDISALPALHSALTRSHRVVAVGYAEGSCKQMSAIPSADLVRQANRTSLGARRPINSHLPRHPHTHPLPLHYTSTCLSSVASSAGKSVRQIAQLAEAQCESRVTANQRPTAAKPMWPFYVSGTSTMLDDHCERGGFRKEDDAKQLDNMEGSRTFTGQC